MKKYISFCKKNIVIVIFALLSSFFTISSYVYSQLDGYQTLLRLLFAIFFSILSSPLFVFLYKFISGKEFISNKPKKVPMIFIHTPICGLLLFLLQMPYFLILYPGICYYDIQVQVDQYDNFAFLTNHPIIHSVYLGFFKNLFENPNTGYAISNLIQMMVCAMAIAYLLCTIANLLEKNWILYALMFFYGLFPIYPLLSMSTTKDIFFSAFMVIFYVDSYKLLTNEAHNHLWLARAIINCVLMIMLRNNALYAFIPTLIIICIYLRKNSDRKLIILFVFTIILYAISNKAIIWATNAGNGSIKEMMSIPSQAMARIYNYSDDKASATTITNYIESPQSYNYYLSDAIKQQLPFDSLDSKCKHFLLDSCILMLKHPVISFDSIMFNTQGFWDVFHCPYSEDHFFLLSFYRGGAYVDCKAFPSICIYLLTVLVKTESYASKPFIIFFNIGLYVWLNLIAAVLSVHRKNRVIALTNVFPVFYLCTLFLGPGAIIRYVFAYIILAPVNFLFMLHYKDSPSI